LFPEPENHSAAPKSLFRCPFEKQKKEWYWVTDPLLLTQKNLYEDYLRPFEDLIRKTGESNDYILRQILICSIINHIQLKQFAPDQIHITFYEKVYADPDNLVSSDFRFIKKPKKTATSNSTKRPSNARAGLSARKAASFRANLP